MKIQIEVCGLWRESEGGYSVNDVYQRHIREFPDNATDRQISRSIASEFCSGYRRDDNFMPADFGWRSGTLAVLADIIE